MKSLTRSLPLALLLRDDVSWLLPAREETPSLGSNAQAAYEILCQRGALFAGQLAAPVQILPAQIGDVLGELAAAGLVTCDGFAALRALIGKPKHKHLLRRRAAVRQPGLSSLESGRWSLLGGQNEPPFDPAARAEHWCRLSLRRYGVVFRDLMARESAAPPWRDLVRAFRRLESRGDIRGGRFVAGVAGEQYALPEVIPSLRQQSDTETAPLLLAGTDPLNLWGRITTGVKVPAAPGCRLVLERGKLLAYRVGGEVHFRPSDIGPELRQDVERTLRRCHRLDFDNLRNVPAPLLPSS